MIDLETRTEQNCVKCGAVLKSKIVNHPFYGSKIIEHSNGRKEAVIVPLDGASHSIVIYCLACDGEPESEKKVYVTEYTR